ncbi:hypothetical protein PO78_4275 [Thauera sp. SWB20]|nr:hypothetical protein PO78_4275 [Thauera sp. SWB20]
MTAMQVLLKWQVRVSIASSPPVRAAFDLHGATELETSAKWPDLTADQSLGTSQVQ